MASSSPAQEPTTCPPSSILRSGLIRKHGTPGTQRRRPTRNWVNRTPPITQKSPLKVRAAISSCQFEFPGQTLEIRNEAFLPQIKVSYDLLDFGRTRAAQRGAREQLIAANFAFNRGIQDVVFNVEKAYYVLSAAKASVSAAEANLKLARTSLGAVLERHEMGLATRPQILMAKQLEAQAVYDIENAKSMVHDAESGLAQAIGVASDVPIRVQSADQDEGPANAGRRCRETD